MRFGVFEVDTRSGELRKQGKKIRVQELPFRLLVCLLQSPGELISREDLSRQLWGETTVDFDDGLHTAVRKLRDALGDSASSPRYIETLPRRGYRFIAPVLPTEEEPQPQLVPQPVPTAPGRPLDKTWIAVAGVALVCLAGLAMWFFATRSTGLVLQPLVLPLTSDPGIESWPALSRDGRRVAYCWDGGGDGANVDIYVENVDGSGRTRITTDPAPDLYPEWSPDGRRIAFLRAGAVYTTTALAGGVETKLGEAAGAGLSWSPDGAFIAVSGRESESGPKGILLLSVGTHRMRTLSTPPGLGIADEQPAFSPDGSQVAFIRRATTVADLYVVPVAGGVPQRITAAGDFITSFAWTADGRELVFSNHGLLRIPVNGSRGTSHVTRIDIAGDGAREPSITTSPDGPGNQIVYSELSQDQDIMGMAIRGDAPTPPIVVAKSTRADHGPSISPDGSRIAFASLRTGAGEIWISAADGSNPVQLTRFRQGIGAGSPTWSPDGRWVVFDATVRDNDNRVNRDIYKVSTAGGPVVRLTSAPGVEAQPSYSRDCRWIYFMSDRSGEHQIWRMPAGGGAAVQVTRKGGYQAFEGPDGRVYYARHHKQCGIWSVLPGGGEETPVLESAAHNAWGIADDGLYYLEKVGPSNARVRRFEFGTHRTETVAAIETDIPEGLPSLSVRRDGRFIAWVVSGPRNADLMRIVNFR